MFAFFIFFICDKSWRKDSTVRDQGFGGQKELINSSKAVPKDFKMKFRSKFDHDFTNPGCLHCAILKAQKT